MFYPKAGTSSTTYDNKRGANMSMFAWRLVRYRRLQSFMEIDISIHDGGADGSEGSCSYR
jgi:hypothetical protein